jgi:hypothetical protein
VTRHRPASQARASGAMTTSGKKCGRATTAKPINNPPITESRTPFATEASE